MRILFLFATDWNHEIAAFDRGEVPAHRLFGYAEVNRMGHEAVVCSTPGFARNLLRRPVFWRFYQAFYAVLRQRGMDCIFAVNEASALPALLLKRLGLLRTPVIVFCTGLMHARNRTGTRKKLWSWLLPCAEAVVSQTSMELESTWKEFNLRQDRQFLIHMLVDTNFFRPDPARKLGDYCLAAGTNEGRDYRTLLKAFPKDEQLTIVTDSYNAEIIARNVEPDARVKVLQAVPIAELKSLYENAKLVLNPLAEIAYCSGHTTLLENMALGKAVIISSVPGMRDYIEDGVTAIAVKPGNVEELRGKIRAYLDDPGRFAAIGAQAREWVGRFSTQEFARHLVRVAEYLLSPVPQAHPTQMPESSKTL